MKYKVYVIEDVASGVWVYVGCTKNKPSRRFAQHLYHAWGYIPMLRDTPEFINYRIGECTLRSTKQKTIILCRHWLEIQPVAFKIIGEFDNIKEASDLEHRVMSEHRPVGNCLIQAPYCQTSPSD